MDPEELQSRILTLERKVQYLLERDRVHWGTRVDPKGNLDMEGL